MSESTAMGISPDTLMDILRVAASKERTVVEFRTRETDDGQELHHAIEITEHVEKLEEDL